MRNDAWYKVDQNEALRKANVGCENDDLIINQTEFIENLLIKYNMFNCDCEYTPAGSNFFEKLTKLVNKSYCELIGSLLYLSNLTRFDIAYCVNYLSRRVNKPRNSCWQAAKRVLWYLNGTRDLSIHYMRREHTQKLIGYADADFGSDPVDRKSFSDGYLFEIGGNFVDWSVRKQQTVALSTAEAEYVSLSLAASQGLWLSSLMSEMIDREIEDSFTIFEDNCSAVYLCKDTCNTN